MRGLSRAAGLRRLTRRQAVTLLVVVAGVLVLRLWRADPAGAGGVPPRPVPVPPTATTAAPADRAGAEDALARAFRERRDDVQVRGEGEVVKVLADDHDGSRHQRFLLRLASGQTLLVAHNIDLAPRLPGLAAGDRVGFSGEYVWNHQGGLVHWTHHDPAGRHEGGWLEYQGQRYQ
ncbi:MAG: DUF3465 domain-containing protein [Lentisphaerae bacterium]|nr:DUF3465 domain-containing protein [Lentisphaerota bacterium]